MAKASPPNPVEAIYVTKKCPECYAHVPLNEEVCPSCKARLGKIKKHGMAERPTNWKAYIICILAWILLIVYVRWAFF